MFSKYKKTDAPKPGEDAPKLAAVPDTPVEAAKTLMKARPVKAAEAAPMDREKKRKERLSEIKLEMHKSLLDNLNLAALETASEAELRQEINAITSESLEEMGIVLNRDERATLSQDLFFEVTGLGPLETLLKDETVNDKNRICRGSPR